MSKFCMGCMGQYDDNIGTCPHCGYKEGTDPVQELHMNPGTILHERYIVGKALGFGGFGVTYIGWDALLENKIAIKEFLPSEFSTRMPGVSYVTVYSGDKYKQFNTGLDRFIEEAKKLAQLNNVENIVTIYDCFKENNTAYIIMEYLEGETIAERLKRDKKIPYSEAVGLLLPIIDALSVVHNYDILHRDIAPDNIFVTKDNKIKLLDFGAARYATTSHSRSLTVIIKPGYSPEEQYRSNGDQGTYTDVYAVAATLYKMITGITPSDALERRANIESKNKDPLKPLVQYCSDIDENTENAILNAMNVRIEDRTLTMSAFKEELTSIAPVKRVAGKIRKIDLLRWPLWAKITIPVLSAVILATGILFATGIIKFSSGPNENIEIADGMTRVPSLINGTVSDADERLKDAVLIYIISGKEYSDDIPADYILTQDISAGSIVVQNSIVKIVVSGGGSDSIEKDFMADLTYMTEKKAKEILKSQGFTPEIKYSTSDTVGEGLVISQNIELGKRLNSGDKIQLVVSTGQPSFSMPSVVGRTESNAKSILSNKGLTCTVKYVFSDTVAKGNVITQSIFPNTQVKKGTNVVLTVSNGAVSISSISIKTNPSKTDYYVGGELITSGLTLTAQYNDGSTKTISSGFTCNPTSLTSAGTKTITVSYSGKSTTFNVSVYSVSLYSISVKTQPTKTSYYVGETLDTSGLTLTAKYNDGSTKTISSGFTCNPTSLTSAGTKTITVSYGGKSVLFSVSVKENISANGTCGKNLKWTLKDGVLTISGTGEMYDFDSAGGGGIGSQSPWYSYGNSINKVVIKSGVTSIGKYAFAQFYGKITSIEISNTVKKIGSLALFKNQQLTKITVDENSKYFKSFDGVLYSYDMKQLIVYPAGKTDKQYTIPSSVEEVGKDAFDHNSYIEEIVIGKKIKSFPTWSFSGLQTLKKITVVSENSYYCSVNGVLYSKNMDTLIKYPPAKSGDKYEIPDGVKNIGDYAFEYSTLKSVILPKTVQSIGHYSFSSCKNIDSITIPKSVTTIGFSAFEYWKENQTIYVVGRTTAPNGWNNWTQNSRAKIIYNP